MRKTFEGSKDKKQNKDLKKVRSVVAQYKNKSFDNSARSGTYNSKLATEE
jgi:hypothetical protein